MPVKTTKLIIFLLALFFAGNIIHAAQKSPDAIAIRVIPNSNHYSPMRWYKEQGFTGSPQSLIVDNYEAVRDGRTVYVNAANVDLDSGIFYTNIYLISYNQEAEPATINIFSQILKYWHFNRNLAEGKTISGAPAECSEDSSINCISDNDCVGRGYCGSAKSQVTRDTIRLARMNDIDALIKEYNQKYGHFPVLLAGTYLPNTSLSVWPSWQEALGQSLGSALHIDPINKLADCPGYNEITCWNEQSKKFAWPDEISLGTLPGDNYVFLYKSFNSGAEYRLCAFPETNLIDSAKSCTGKCIPICFNKECGGDGCEGTCPPGCSGTDICANGACVPPFVCGDGACAATAECAVCLSDCGADAACCDNDGECDPGETGINCPGDCVVSCIFNFIFPCIF